MHYGEMLDENRYCECIQLAYTSGIRTFVTADVYGAGRADQMLAKALAGVDRNSYCLVGAVGHDFYKGERQGSSGYPRFTHPDLRSEKEYASYLKEATEKSLANCGTDYFDLLLLHNPDEQGYLSEKVWEGLSAVKSEGLTGQLGLAPGPANGFVLDMVDAFERYSEIIDWTMVILNPMEPWPGGLVTEAAVKYGVKLMTRVADYGGVFHDDLKPGHEFRPGDHRTYRPEGWVERGCDKLEKMRPYADKHGLTMMQFAAIWNLSHPAVECVVPTFTQEISEGAISIDEKIKAFGKLPELIFSPEEVAEIREIGDNTGCMKLKGASQRHTVSERPDEWPMRPELLELAQRYHLGTAW